MGLENPGDPNNPIQGLLGDLMKLIGSATAGRNAWEESAKALAHSVAADGATDEGNADPLFRIQLEELARVAELHVAEATGLPVGSGAHPVTFAALGRPAWALRVLEAWKPQIEKMVAAQAALPPPHPGEAEGHLGGPGGAFDTAGLADFLGRFATTMGPVLIGMQFGSAAGHLAQRALGQYALPLPWPRSDELCVVPQNIAAFAEDWSLPADQARLWVCVRELTAHTVLSRPHVAQHIRALLDESSAADEATPQRLMERLSGEGLDPEDFQSMLSDPEALLSGLLSPEQEHISARLVATTTALGGYVDHVTGTVASSLLGSASTLAEAWYRYRIEESAGEQAAGALFGLVLDREQVDRGAAFVRGVLERAGEEGLGRLWSDERNLPTPAEVDAPGLWLERISLPEED